MTITHNCKRLEKYLFNIPTQLCTNILHLDFDLIFFLNLGHQIICIISTQLKNKKITIAYHERLQKKKNKIV